MRCGHVLIRYDDIDSQKKSDENENLIIQLKKIVFVTIIEYLQNIILSILIIFFIFYTYISREGKERENKLLHTRKLRYVKL